MAERLNERIKGVNWNSPWPYTKAQPLAKNPGKAYTLGISIDPIASGLVAFWPSEEGAPTLTLDNGTLWGKDVKFRPFYSCDSIDIATKFCVTFCMRGYGNYPALSYQDGVQWLFNWSSLTISTVRMASQVADHYFNDRYEEAWVVGKAFGEQIRMAENEYWDKKRDKL